MAEVQDLPAVPIHAVELPLDGPECTTRELMNACFALANNNPRFRRGQSDQVGFTIEEFGVVPDVRSIREIPSLEYTFRAVRSRLPDKRPVVSFTFGLEAQFSRVPLPHYLVDPVVEKMSEGFFDIIEAGLLTKEDIKESAVDDELFNHAIERYYSLSNIDNTLESVERHTWKNEDDEVLHEVKTNVEEGDRVVIDDESTIMGGELAVMSDPEGLLDRYINEPYHFESNIEKELFWGKFENIATELSKDKEENKRAVRVAYGVLLHARRALLTQAGIKVPRVTIGASAIKQSMQSTRK